ncbi:uncharacterized protein [Littorina saxatilis]|uniref:EGF-like domain-containing protein n=2 Tax=Littorina saxatilis TaxID=31220 RepID=A0AAN9BB10_9CAEN
MISFIITGGVLFAFSSLASGQMCSPNPCQNEGDCVPLHDENKFKCNCLFGFSGETCEIPSRCTFKHIVHGVNDTADIDIVKLSGLNLTDIDACKQKCHDTAGCRAVEVKLGGCNVYRQVPLTVPDIVVMTSEKERVFAIRRCFKRKTSSSTATSKKNENSKKDASASDEKPKSTSRDEKTSPQKDKSTRKPDDAHTEL